MLVTFISSDLLWPDLDVDLFKYVLRNHAVPLLDIYRILGDFELFAASLSYPMVQIVRTVFFLI